MSTRGLKPTQKKVTLTDKMAEESQKKTEHGRAFVTMCLVGNIALCISIVMLNKMVYTYYGFPNITMTYLHFIFTAVGMYICKIAGVFQA